MMNYLFCFDKNYIVPANCSIFSLLENSIEKINVYIMNKDYSDPNFLSKKVLNHRNLNSINVSRVNLSNYNFPNIFGTHVSEATYYRLFLQDYITDDIDFITYVDCDVFANKNPESLLQKHIENMKLNNKTISVCIESSMIDYGKNELGLKSNKYFNAGVMIIDFKKWKTNDLKDKFLKIMYEYQQKLLFWDQDILNIYFDGDFEIMDDSLNFKFDMERNNESSVSANVSLIHYSGKFKPWSIKGAVNYHSEYFQSIYRNLYNKKYFFLLNYKKNGLSDFINIFLNKTIFHTKYPFSFFLISLKRILK